MYHMWSQNQLPKLHNAILNHMTQKPRVERSSVLDLLDRATVSTYEIYWVK